MKLLVLKEKLKQGLSIIEKATGKNLNLPILNNVLISASNNLLNLSSTNLEIAIKYWILTKIEKEGKTTIPAKFLYNFISSLLEEKLTLEQKDKNLLVSWGENSTQIKTQSVDDFPIIPEIKEKEFIEVNNLPFCQAVSQVINFCSITNIRPEISGIYFNFKKDQARFAATDSFRLAEKIVFFEEPLKLKKEYSFILPQRTARELINIFSTEGESPKLRIYLNSNQIMFERLLSEISHPQVELISRLIEGEYPNYEEIIPKSFETKIILDRENFLNQIRTASLFCARSNEIHLKTDPDNKKGILIFAQNPELGESKGFVPGNLEGKESEVVFNYRFLIEGLENMKSREISLGLNGDTGPALLRPVGDQSYLYVLMPIKNT
ncbi:MAG: DNA polymerase III subunit beta [Candidatus Nealsonbacteria bacterium]|nr:DNA polymerase III subunit beta [Candidatus Nealsonbacteria bacterium]